MRNKFILLFLISISTNLFSQTVLWTEAFQNACVSDCDATAYVGPNGPWTQTLTGVNGIDPNVWYVSGAECGNNAGICGSVCGAPDPSLHVGSNISVVGDQGAAYLAGGLGIWFPETDRRIESPAINMTGQSTLTLSFNYIENGDLANDNATLWYFDGVTWALLIDLPKTLLTCAPQGVWTAFSIALPASANNNPAMKIGFRWVNNDDNVGTDPSFAVDDIQVTTPAPPVADFNTALTTICDGNCITFNNTSTFVAGATFSWDFGDGQTSAIQTPLPVCYNNPGTFTVTLIVTDLYGTDTEIKTNYITVNVCPDPTAEITASSMTVCAGQSIIFNDNSTGTNISVWTWSFGSGTPGTANTEGPHSVQFNTAGTFNIWLQVTDDNGVDDTTIQITVLTCSAPTAAFSISDATICPGACITYTNNSTTTGPTTYAWTFIGGAPTTSSSSSPGPICYSTSGTYTTTLLVTNSFGSNTYSQNIIVEALPTITATGGAVIDPGQTVSIAATVSAGTITWSASPLSQLANLDCVAFDCSTADVSPVITTVYTATVTSSQGCTVSDNVIIAVNSPAGGYTVGVPNTFSPDGNDENDVLKVRSFQDKLISTMLFRVYNRYGQLVFETTDQNEGWDGKFKGEEEKPATFVYTLDYTLVDGTSGKMNGNVTLIR